MNTQEMIENNNELIAKYMGYQIIHKKFQYRNWNSSDESYFENGEGNIVCDKKGHEVNLYPDGDPLFELSELPFDSYEWLMPVIQKISDYGCIIEINYALVCTCRICYLGKNKNDKAINFYGDNNGVEEPIMAIYKCVVEFLKYLEENK